MAILITGSTGYIGSHLTRKLADTGEEIRLLVRRAPELEGFDRPNIRICRGDITDAGSVQEAVKGVRQVYHLAAYARLWARDPQTFRRINVDGTRNVLQACLESGVEKVVYVSTAGVIGPSKPGIPMNEDMPRLTGYFNLYESTKAETETLAREYHAKGLQVVILNPSRVYGPGLDTGSNPFTKIMERYLKGDWKVIPGSGEDLGSYCFIDDVVDGHIAAMANGRSGERYILGGDNQSFRQFMEYVADSSGIHTRLKKVPFSLLIFFSYLQLWKAQLTGREPMITPDWVRKYKYDWALDSSKAQRELGYRIRPLKEGVDLTVRWLKTHRP